MLHYLGNEIAWWAGTITAALLVCGTIVRYIYLPLQRIVRVALKIEPLVKELMPNGGTSMKDLVTRINERMIQLEMRFQATVLETSHGIIYTDGDGHVTWANWTFCRMVDRDLTELRGSGWIYAIAPKDRNRVMAEWAEAVREKRNYESSHSFINSSDREIPASVVAYCMHDEKGSILGYFAKVWTGVSHARDASIATTALHG